MMRLNSTWKKRPGKQKKRAEDSARFSGPGLWPGLCVLGLLTGTGCGGRLRLTVSLGDADVAADGVFAELVDDQLFGNLGAAQIEEDRLVHVAILLFDFAVLGGHGDAVLRALFVDALEFDSQVANLLGLILAGDGEFHVVAFAKAAELINFVVIAGNERTHFTASHFQVFASGVEVGANADDLGVHILQVISGSLGGEFGVNAGIESAQLGGGIFNG